MSWLNQTWATSTSLYNYTISQIDPYNLPPLVECYKLQIIGSFCVILYVASFLSNSALLWLFFKFKDLQTSMNIFIIGLTVINFFGTILELPWIIVSNLRCRWIFDKFGCIISAFLMYTIGCASIYMMVVISFERFYIIYRPMSIRANNLKLKLGAIAGCLLIGLFWATMPLVGWSHYSLEGAYTSCSVEWRERSLNVTSYNITIFGLVYLVPVLVIFVTNIKLISLVRNIPRKMSSQVELQKKKRMASERYMTIIIMFLIAAFLISWTPYAIVSMYTAFIDPDGLSPLMGTVPALFAKSSMLWTSLIFIWSNRAIRVKLLSKMGILRFMLCCSNSVDSALSTPANNVSRDKNARVNNSLDDSNKSNESKKDNLNNN